MHLPENRADPHRILAELRCTDPVHYDPARECWMLTRYRDVLSVLHHGQFVSSRLVQPARITSAGTMSLHSILAQQMLFWDGEEHLRLRQVLLKPLALMSTSMHAYIEGIVENLLTDMQAQDSLDIVHHFPAHRPFLGDVGAFFPSHWAMAALGSTVGLHGDKFFGDKLIGGDYAYQSIIFSTSSRAQVAGHIFFIWFALLVMIALLIWATAYFLKRKDIRG